MIAPFKPDLSDTDQPSNVVMGSAPKTTIKAPGGVQRAIAIGIGGLVASAIVAWLVSWQVDNPDVILATMLFGVAFTFLASWSELNRESRAHAKAIDREAYAKQAAVESNQRMAEETHSARLDVWKDAEKAKAEVERAKAEPHRVQADIMRRLGETLIARVEMLPLDPASTMTLLRLVGVDVNKAVAALPPAIKSANPDTDEDGLVKPDIKINGGLSGATWPLEDGRLASVDLIERVIRYTYNYEGDARERMKDKGVSFGNDDFAKANDALVELGIKARVGDSGKTRWVVPYDVARQAVPYLKAGQRPPIPLP